MKRPLPDRPANSIAEVSSLLNLAILVVVVAGLYFGRDIFIPLALAMLVSFALAPIVRWLRRWRVPNLPAVLASVLVAFLVVLAVGWAVAWQGAQLANRLPAYQRNIEQKIDMVFQDPPGGQLLSRAIAMVRDIGRKVEEEAAAPPEEDTPGTSTEEASEPDPIPVVLHRPDATAIELVQSIIGPLVSPLATAGIVIVFVIFLLWKHEDLRDRFIRLLGPRDLPRTTQAMDDAAQRVSRYLLMQLVVNVTYGIPIGVGIWLIGIPNPILWAILCIVLRFVPYIGPIIAAFFPLALAIAVDPGWTMFFMAGALIIVVELISNNLVEPWLYGASTSLSPLAILAAAVFWTWLWGPIGLLLSTPLTVCFVVIGRNVPQFGFLDVLLGSEPALTPAERLYKHLLVGKADDATEEAEEELDGVRLSDYLDDVAIPALALAESDRARAALDEERVARVAASAMILGDNLAEWEGQVLQHLEDETTVEVPPEQQAGPSEDPTSLPLVVCAGARGRLDEAAAALLGVLLEKQDVRLRLLPFDSLQRQSLRELDLAETRAIALSYMNADSLAHARFLVRRLRRHMPEARILVGLWTFPGEDIDRRNPQSATGADHVSTSLAEAARYILDESKERSRVTDRAVCR